MKQQGKDPDNSGAPKSREAERKEYYSRLHRKFILITLICSLVPLLSVGWIINIYYTSFAEDKMTASFQTEVTHHRMLIELFLMERCSKLRLLTQTHSKEYLGRMDNLAHVFEIMNQEHGAITDIGVISEQGRHVAYVGPYELMDKDYSETLWFKLVIERGSYISDMFTGFRKVWHFIIAIAREEKGEKWILRATIDTEVFRSLVETCRIGRTGEVFLVNEQGYYQTSPRLGGKIMERSSMPLEPYHEGIKVRTIDSRPQNAKEQPRREIIATTWLNEPRWMLVVRQEYSEAFGEVNYANFAVLVFLHLSALTIVVVTFFITRLLINVIRKRDEQANHLNEQLMEVSKMASLGELSAGVAHEINKPLAVILTERQILLDVARLTPDLDENFHKELTESLAQIDVQVNRCKQITHQLLRFSQRTKSVIETVDLNAFLSEVVELMEGEARSAGIKFITSLDECLKPVQSDPSQLQQVFLNLITNAIDAHQGKLYGSIRISTRADDRTRKAKISIADTGSGNQ